MPEFTTRALCADDYDLWLALFLEYVVFYEAELSDEVIKVTWQRLLNPQESLFGLVGQDGAGHMVGICHYLFHQSTWSIMPYCYLEDLFVSPKVRNSGAGRLMIEAVYEHAQRKGAARVYWQTQDFNHAARKLYDNIADQTPFIIYRKTWN